MQLVLVRSRPGSQAVEQAIAAASCPVRLDVAGDQIEQFLRRLLALTRTHLELAGRSGGVRRRPASGRWPRSRAPGGSPRSAIAPPTRSDRDFRSRRGSGRSRRRTRRCAGRAARAPTSHGSARPSRRHRCRRGPPGQIRPPDRLGDGADDPGRHGCHVRREQMLGEQLAVHGQEVLEALPQLALGHRREIGTASAQLDRERAMIGQAGEIGQRGLSEHPRERLADLRRQVGPPVARLLARSPGCRAGRRRTARPSPATTAPAPARRTGGRARR